MAKEVNYTDVQVQTMRDMVAEAGGRANLEVATRIGQVIGKSTKSVTAKLTRMGVPYDRKERTRNDEVVRKSDLVARIAERAGVDAEVLATLTNASGEALRTLDAALAA